MEQEKSFNRRKRTRTHGVAVMEEAVMEEAAEAGEECETGMCIPSHEVVVKQEEQDDETQNDDVIKFWEERNHHLLQEIRILKQQIQLVEQEKKLQEKVIELKESENRKLTSQLAETRVRMANLKRHLDDCNQKSPEAQSASREVLTLNEQVANLQSHLMSSGEELSPALLWSLNPTLQAQMQSIIEEKEALSVKAIDMQEYLDELISEQKKEVAHTSLLYDRLLDCESELKDKERCLRDLELTILCTEFHNLKLQKLVVRHYLGGEIVINIDFPFSLDDHFRNWYIHSGKEEEDSCLLFGDLPTDGPSFLHGLDVRFHGKFGYL